MQIDTTPASLPTGAISGYAFDDVTLNNIYEPGDGDTLLSGVVVFLDSNHNGLLDGGEQSTSTAGDGSYSFTGLADGTYDIRQQVPAGYVAQTQARLIDAGQAFSDVNFGNFPIVYNGSAGDDTYTLRLKSGDPSTVEIVQSLNNAAPVVYSAPASLLPSLTFTPGDGNDSLTINDAVPFAVSFSGGANPAYSDDLNVNAGTFAFADDAQLTTANLNLNVGGASASVTFAATQHLKSLSITAGSATIGAKRFTRARHRCLIHHRRQARSQRQRHDRPKRCCSESGPAPPTTASPACSRPDATPAPGMAPASSPA